MWDIYIYNIPRCLLFLFVRVCTLKKNWCYYLQSLFSFALSLSFSWVLLLFYHWVKGTEKRERENCIPFSSLSFLRVRPFCPSFSWYLYTHTHTLTYGRNRCCRSIKSYIFIYIRSPVLHLFLLRTFKHTYISILSIIILVLFSCIFFFICICV